MISATTWALRQTILRKYGGRCRCVCGCQESNLRRLQVDHKYGHGNDDRKTLRGERWYAKLLAQPVDPTLELLCAGCHWERTMHGWCQGQGEGRHGPEVTQTEEYQSVSGVTPLQQEVHVGPFDHLNPALTASRLPDQAPARPAPPPTRRWWR
jgi:hypothetical protein